MCDTGRNTSPKAKHMEDQNQPTVVKPKESAAAANPFAVPAWKRPLYFASDTVETYLEGFEKLRARRSGLVKTVAMAVVVVLVLATVVTMNLRHMTLLPV